MTLALIAPRTRRTAKTPKGNKYWLVRGRYDGRTIEISSGTTDKAAAKKFLRDLERELAKGTTPRAGDAVTFADAARAYAAFRGLDLDNPQIHHGRLRADVVGINRLIGLLGRDQLATINHARLVSVVNQLFPNHSAATRNREALRPAGAILHYAADQGWCPWLKVKLLREPRPRARAVSKEIAGLLINAVAEDATKQLLLVWLFQTGMRISGTLRVAWDHIDLDRRVVQVHVSKTDDDIEVDFEGEVREHLERIPEEQRHGRLFPWTEKSSVYSWLRPLTARLGVKFTPHMARHSKGTWMNAEGAGLVSIMQQLGHKDIRSSARYQMADIEVVRAVNARIGRLGSPLRVAK